MNGVPDAVTFWHGPSSWLYTCPLGNGQFEVTTMTSEPDLQYEKVSWGQDATVEENAKHFKVGFWNILQCNTNKCGLGLFSYRESSCGDP